MENAQSTADLSGSEVIQGLASRQIPAPEIARTFPIELSRWTQGTFYASVTLEPRFLNPNGMAHGGWLSGVLDSGMYLAGLTCLPPRQTIVTREMTTTFLRPLINVACDYELVAQVDELDSASIRLSAEIRGADTVLHARATSICAIKAPQRQTGLGDTQ